MTDNEIKKALDILDKLNFFNQRAGRELWGDKPTDVQDKDIENFSKDVAFLKDFFNRQKAEIERLEKSLTEQFDSYENIRKKAKAEAVKEFAERVKEYPIKMGLPLLGLQTKSEVEKYFDGIMLQVRDSIDNLVKEFTEGKDNGK